MDSVVTTPVPSMRALLRLVLLGIAVLFPGGYATAQNVSIAISVKDQLSIRPNQRPCQSPVEHKGQESRRHRDGIRERFAPRGEGDRGRQRRCGQCAGAVARPL